MMPINSHDGTNNKVDDTTNYRTDNEQQSAANAVDDKEDSSSSNEENDILDNGKCESGISRLSR